MTLSSKSGSSPSPRLTFRELLAMTPAFQQVVASSLVQTSAAQAVARELYTLQLTPAMSYEVYYELLEESLIAALPQLTAELRPTLSDAIGSHLRELKHAFHTEDYERAVVARLLEQSGEAHG